MSTYNTKFAQLQPFTLSGAGAVTGATSIILKSMTDIDGNALSMSGTFGTIGFGTLEPGNGTLEEQISFTGLTNNTNGTVTLSGVSSVAFVYPYTQTSGLAKTHAGSTSFVISNTAGFYDKFVAKDDDGTISETLTFTVPNFPQMSDATTMPTVQAQLATKAYADSLAIAGAPDASTSVKGIVQLPTQVQVDAKTATGSTGAALSVTPDVLRSTLLSDYVIDTGAADAYVITPSPAIAAYATGQIFTFKAVNTNTTTSTLNVNGKGATTIKKPSGNNLVAGDIIAGQLLMVEYDGTNFQLISKVAPDAATQKGVQNSSYVYNASSAGTDTYAITVSPTPAAYVAGQVFYFLADVANTGAATLNVNTLGAIAIKKGVSLALNDNDIAAGQVVQVQYDGTNFQMLSPISNANTYAIGVLTDLNVTAAGNNDLTITTGFAPRLIKLYYWIQGHTDSGGTNVYSQQKGIAEYSGTVCTFNDIAWSAASSGSDNTAPTVATTGLTFGISPSLTSVPTIGAAGSGSQGITVTLTINSTSATGFVVRRATTISNTNGSAGRASISYEAWA